MKLYTEEQVKEVWKAGNKYWETSGASITLEELLEQLTSIELLSDEEIEQIALEFAKKYRATTYEISALIIGAKLMRDKLTNNKEK